MPGYYTEIHGEGTEIHGDRREYFHFTSRWILPVLLSGTQLVLLVIFQSKKKKEQKSNNTDPRTNNEGHGN
jgi:hypothetical protein